ncbi:MAG: HEAT repeat domain-containing protein [Dehalococcoidia bacterium]|nr:HEAT repeat domain-containing protein [Dehalococcoidia bacterium]
MQIDSNRIKSLIASLGEKDAQARQSAYESLVSIGKPATTLLIEALSSHGKRIRREAASALGEIGDPEAVTALTNLLGDKDGLLNKCARDALVSIGKLSVPSLIEASADKNKQVRWNVAKALGEIADPASVPALIKLLEDKEFEVRWLAAEGLIVLGKEGLPPLLQELVLHADTLSLNDGMHLVIRNLAEEDEYQEILMPVLKAMDGLDTDISVPMAAKAAMGKL